MLEDLAPGAPATLRWPLYREPPPHFLVGYQYLVRTCNDYVFESRAYSRLRYTEITQPGMQVVNWSVMANCTYTINTGSYHRFVDLDDFQTPLLKFSKPCWQKEWSPTWPSWSLSAGSALPAWPTEEI